MDASVHRRLYSEQPAAKALLHSHGPHSVALSFAGQDFRPVDVEGRTYFESVPVVSVDYEKHPEEAPETLASALAERHIAMVRGHGVYAWGDTLEQAYKWTCSLELSAGIYVVPFGVLPAERLVWKKDFARPDRDSLYGWWGWWSGAALWWQEGDEQ